MSTIRTNKLEPVQLSVDEAFELVNDGYRFDRAKPTDEVRYRINGQLYGAECTGRCSTIP